MAETSTIGSGGNKSSDSRALSEQYFHLIAFGVGNMFYGIYVVLFFTACYILVKNGLRKNTVNMVFFISQVFMFIMATITTAINFYRYPQAFALGNAPDPSAPISLFKDFTVWYNSAWPVIVTTVVLTGDALVIYRLFIVWKGNVYVIILPCLLLAFAVAVNSITLTWLTNPKIIAFTTAHPFFGMVYPLNVAQNILTTGLLAFKIWSHHVRTKAAGLTVAMGLELTTVIRIILESAMIYTFQQILLLITYQVDTTGQLVLHVMVVPTVGIVFALMAIRTHAAKMDLHSRNPTNSRMTTSISRGNAAQGMSVLTSVTTSKHVDYSEDIKIGDLQRRGSDV